MYRVQMASPYFYKYTGLICCTSLGNLRPTYLNTWQNVDISLRGTIPTFFLSPARTQSLL